MSELKAKDIERLFAKIGKYQRKTVRWKSWHPDAQRIVDEVAKRTKGTDG